MVVINPPPLIPAHTEVTLQEVAISANRVNSVTFENDKSFAQEFNNINFRLYRLEEDMKALTQLMQEFIKE